MARLATRPGEKCSFSDLRDELGMTAGNLSSQLSVLESSGYIAIEKKFRGKKPLTEITLTDEGTKAFGEYIDSLDDMIAELKAKNKGGPDA